jgi:CHAD domain-containing protein
MSFELKPDQSVRKGVRRLMRKQMDEALEKLTQNESRDEAVHEARKCFKKMRAVLRLVQPVIGKRSYRQENACLRDAGRPLTEVRDAKILVETLDQLAERFKDHVGDRTFGQARAALQDNLRLVRKRVLDKEDAFAVAADVVQQAGKRIKDCTDVPNKWVGVGPGVEEVYRRAREAHQVAMTDRTVEALHEWRKQAKYLRYQLEVLRPLWPERLEELANEADRMSELLGDDHDLATLRGMLMKEPEHYGDESDREMLFTLIDRRRAELEQEAMLLAERFFQERPRAFARRLHGYWKTWRKQTEQEESEQHWLATAGT